MNKHWWNLPSYLYPKFQLPTTNSSRATKSSLIGDMVTLLRAWQLFWGVPDPFEMHNYWKCLSSYLCPKFQLPTTNSSRATKSSLIGDMVALLRAWQHFWGAPDPFELQLQLSMSNTSRATKSLLISHAILDRKSALVLAARPRGRWAAIDISAPASADSDFRSRIACCDCV